MGVLVIMEQVSVLLVMMAIGVFASRRGLLTEQLTKGLTDILLRISLPALIVLSFAIDADGERMRSALAVVAVSVVFHAIMLPLGALFFRGCAPERRSVLVFAAHFPNIGFMGMPLVYAIFGVDGIFYTSLFMIPFNIVMWTYGRGMFLSEGQKVTWQESLTDPIIGAIVLGLIILVVPWPLPGLVLKPLQSLGATTTPLAMLVIGHLMSRTTPAEVFSDRDILWGMLVRLGLAPVIMFGILQLIPMEPLAFKICIVLEALPAAVALAVIPARYGGDAAMASRCVVVSHVLSVLTLPLMLAWLAGA